MCKFQYQNGKKRKNGKAFSGFQKDYKLRQGFQIEATKFQSGAGITDQCRI